LGAAVALDVAAAGFEGMLEQAATSAPATAMNARVDMAAKVLRSTGLFSSDIGLP
jgi:hypothetical protein